MAAVAAAIPVFGDEPFAFLVLVLALAVFLVAAFFLAAFLALAAVVVATLGGGVLNTLAAPAVGSSVQAHNPLMSAQAWPTFAVPQPSVTSRILPSGSRT